MTAKARPPATLVWGEDPYLVREGALSILGETRATEVDAADWQGDELQGLATPSLFGEPRALLVNDARSLRKEAVDQIGRYLAAPDADATLILACVVAERGKPPAALVKVVEAVGEVRKADVARKEATKKPAANKTVKKAPAKKTAAKKTAAAKSTPSGQLPPPKKAD